MLTSLRLRFALMVSAASIMIAPGVGAAEAQDATAAGTQVAAAPEKQVATGDVESISVIGKLEHYRGDVPLQELPQSIQVLSANQLTEVGVTTLSQALELTSGFSKQNSFGGAWDSFAVRGFAGDPNTPSGFLVNGFNGGRGFGGPRDTSNVERIEIVKGPASALFGRGEPGGTVNILTKKPKFDEEGSLTVSAGSYARYRAEGDFTTGITDNFAFRVNGAAEHAHSFRDTIITQKQTISPSFLLNVTDDTTVTYEIEATHQEIPFDRGVVAVNGVLGLIPNSRFLGEPGNGPNRINVLGHQVEMQHNFNSQWALLVGFGYRDTSLYGYGEDPEFAVGRNPFFTDGRTLSRRRILRDYTSTDIVPRAELSGKFETGSFTHHVLIGSDYEDFKLSTTALRYRPPAFTSTSTLAQLNAVDIYNPVYGNLPAVGPTPFQDNAEHDKAVGFYAHDQIDITDKLKLHVGVRYDNFKQSILNRLNTNPATNTTHQDVNAVSPSASIGYDVTDWVNVYFAYGKGFRPNTGADFNLVAFKPEKTNSYEVGAKFKTLDDKISGTVALFKTDKTNIITADPNHAGFSFTFGSAGSKGVEFDVTGQLPWDFRILASYAYIDAGTSVTFRDPDFGLLIPAGSPLINVAPHNFNALLIKDFQVYEKPATFGVGVNYVDKRLGETGTAYYLPSYTLVKLISSIDITEKVRLQGEVTNLFDKRYYPMSYAAIWTAPGAPRQYSLRATYRF